MPRSSLPHRRSSITRLRNTVPWIAWAHQLGRDDAAAILMKTLEEEKAADKKLTSVAEAKLNRKRRADQPYHARSAGPKTGAFFRDQQPTATDESIRGVPTTDPLAPVVAPLAAEPVMQGRGIWQRAGLRHDRRAADIRHVVSRGCVWIGGTTFAPGMADCVFAGFACGAGSLLLFPTVPGSCPLLVLPGDGLDGATPVVRTRCHRTGCCRTGRSRRWRHGR